MDSICSLKGWPIFVSATVGELIILHNNNKKNVHNQYSVKYFYKTLSQAQDGIYSEGMLRDPRSNSRSVMLSMQVPS